MTVEAYPSPASVRSARAAFTWLEGRALLVVAVATVIALCLAGIPQHLGQDGWLALVAGRQIAAHGIPQYDYFSHMAYGARWIDQQWLAQFVMYEMERIGGLQLLTVLYVLVTGFAFGFVVFAARDLGGEDLHVLMVLPAGAFFYLVTAVSIRTQGLAYPLFVLTLWLLATEVRTGSRRRRVYWVFPMLVLWANLHGSVTLGVGLASLYGLWVLITGLRTRGLGGLRDARGWTFLVLPPLALLATPYGTSIVHYYRVTMLNSEFSRMVTEWKPALSVPLLAIPLFLLIAAAAVVMVLALARARTSSERSARLFDAVVLVVLAVGAVTAIRNITWFGLAVMILLPSAITRMKRGAPAPLRRSRLNLVFALVMTAAAALGAVAVLARPDSWFTSSYSTKAIPTLQRLIARDPNVKIFADVRYADWLIWEKPKLFSGRVAYDTSLELLTPAEMAAISDPAAPGHERMLAPYGIWMLYPNDKSVDRKLLKGPGIDVVSRSKKVIIATHAVGRVARDGQS